MKSKDHIWDQYQQYLNGKKQAEQKRILEYQDATIKWLLNSGILLSDIKKMQNKGRVLIDGIYGSFIANVPGNKTTYLKMFIPCSKCLREKEFRIDELWQIGAIQEDEFSLPAVDSETGDYHFCNKTDPEPKKEYKKEDSDIDFKNSRWIHLVRDNSTIIAAFKDYKKAEGMIDAMKPWNDKAYIDSLLLY